jgi:hypothetical protein
VNGARVREDDEGHAPARTMTARYPGTCAETGRRIAPGDLISYDRATRRTVLVTPAVHGVSDVFQTSGGTFYRNRAGRCEDAPCCGCCTI